MMRDDINILNMGLVEVTTFISSRVSLFFFKKKKEKTDEVNNFPNVLQIIHGHS